MPIYEYYCRDNNTIYQFFAKTLAQGERIPVCPADPAFHMEKIVSSFAITKGSGGSDSSDANTDAPQVAGGGMEDPGDARMDQALAAMENEFSSVDENDPRAMGRMMRRMAELTGERIDGEMEEVVRKLEEGTDPEALEDMMGGTEGDGAGDEEQGGAGQRDGEAAMREAKYRYRKRRAAPRRDPNIYDY